jgi:hypothetical protein
LYSAGIMAISSISLAGCRDRCRRDVPNDPVLD